LIYTLILLPRCPPDSSTAWKV